MRTLLTALIPQARSSDAFYDSLEKVVNELRSSVGRFVDAWGGSANPPQPEAGPFLKPVSKRDAPDYFTCGWALSCNADMPVVKKPMDLSTVLRNVKTHKYKNKKDFAHDLDLIWENCLLYNSTPVGRAYVCSVADR